MVNINKRIMLEGMRADFQKVDRLSVKVLETVRQAKADSSEDGGGDRSGWRIESELPLGENERNYQSGKVGNLPGGEVFTTPGEVNGTFVIDEWWAIIVRKLAIEVESADHPG